MHGIILRPLELMVCQKFGEKKWEEMKQHAGIKMSGNVLVTEYYSDSVTYKLIEAANDILGVGEHQFLEMQGEYFFDYVVENGYSRLLSSLGETPVDFLENLDTLHLALGRIYPIQAPLFRCEKLKNGNYVLHYYSKRSKKMQYYMVGLIKRTLFCLYKTTVEMKFLHKSIQENRYTFSIKFRKSSTIDGEFLHQPITVPVEQFFPGMEPVISPMTFAKLCPFHIILDKELNIKQCGMSLIRALPAILSGNRKLKSKARLIRPLIPMTPEIIKEHLNTGFLMEFSESGLVQLLGQEQSFKVCGQMLLVEDENFLFLGSPYITALDDMQRKGFCLADIPLHDAKRDFILASENFALEHQTLQQLEELTQKLQQTTKMIKDETIKTDRLIYSVLPPAVAESLRKGRNVVPQRYESVTILFSGIVDFDKFCLSKSGQMGAREVVQLLNTLYSRFDALLDVPNNPHLYKVETVMDKYMVVSGAPIILPDGLHAEEIALLSLKMIKNIKAATMDEETVSVTIGIHSGEIVTGVIGQRMPRYCLFGDTVNTASRIQSGGLKGQINISEETFRCLERNKNSRISSSQMEFFGEILLKGKTDPMKVWLLKDANTLQSLKQRSQVCYIL